MTVLGISGLYHDAAAAVVVDGVVVAAVQEERLSRVKHDPSLPARAIASCLEIAEVAPGDLEAVVYYDKPLTTAVRLLKTYVAAGASGVRTFPRAWKEWTSNKLWVAYGIERELRSLGHRMPGRLLYAEHHVSHAAAAFFPSPYDSACVITSDGLGEWASSSIGWGRGNQLDLLEELRFPHSLGLLYSAFTSAAGFRVNSGEYKLMGLAPFGEPVYRERILEHLIDLRDDGSFTVDLQYFDYLVGSKMTSTAFDRLFDGPPRRPDGPISQRDCDLAASMQDVLEEVVLRVGRHAHQLTGERVAVLGGGVALNCVANERLRRDGPFDEVWVQPAAGDAGSAVGCALWAHHVVAGADRPATGGADGMSGCYLGPRYAADQIGADLEEQQRPHRRITDPDERARTVAALLADGAVVGMFQGRMEFGPRALGHRSILADPRGADTQRRINLQIKKRESFRPFAPAVLAEEAATWFDLDHPSPYMLFVAPVRAAVPAGTLASPDAEAAADAPADLAGALARIDSPIPAVTHVDGTARIQTVDAASSPAFHRLLAAFHDLTGCPVLVNTSFNVRGEPIVESPEDAYRCFMTTDLDWLVLEDCLLDKREQPAWTGPVPAPAAD